MTGIAGFRIRDLSTREEFEACVRLQEEVWGEAFSQGVPLSMFDVAARLGGVVAGAFAVDRDELVGFVFGLTGLEAGVPVHWSDMLAVREDARGRGLARALKLHQRDRLLDLGVGRMYWTFEPLEARNAHLNLNRLGARIGEYVQDMYGVSDSPLHQGIGTDRFVARWELNSLRVRALAGEEVEGPAPPDDSVELVRTAAEAWGFQDAAGFHEALGIQEALGVASLHGDVPEPGDPLLDLEGSRLLVAIPARIQELKSANAELAIRWRRATRAALSHYLARGWEARALLGTANRPALRYLLVKEA